MPNSFQAKGNAGKPSMDIAKRNSNLISNPIHNGIYNMSSNKQNCNFNKKTRVPFTAEEDEKIKTLAEKYGTKQWSLISSFVKGRTPKQCRDRYCNYLFPGYFKGEWTKEEDELLEKLYIENGPKWSIIQKSFPERSQNSVKNRWNYFLCRQKNKTKKKEDNDLDDVNFELQNEFDLNEGDNELQTFSVFSQNNDFLYSQNDDLFGHPLVQNKVDMNIKNDENNEIEKKQIIS